MKSPAHPGLTFFRHGCNLGLAVLLAATLGRLAMTSSLLSDLPWMAAGLAIFVVMEYTTHRFALHAPPSPHPLVLQLQKRLHYDHHVTPNNLDLLFAPAWFIGPLVVGYALLYYVLSHSLTIALSMMFGNLAGLLYYEWVHYVAHIPVTPMTAWGRRMKKHHLLHHFKNEHFWFGVTNPLGDYAGDTMRDREAVQKSGTTKQIHVEQQVPERETAGVP